METRFFRQIAEMNIMGDLQITISNGAEDTFIVSTILHNDQCGDNAKQQIAPLNLKGTANELDEGYFKMINEPIKKASGLLSNMEAFLKQLEIAKAKSAMEKDKAEKLKKEKEEKDKKYKEAISKADALEAEGKYREAWMKLPDPTMFPEQAETIRKRRTVLSSKFPPDLFAAAATEIEAPSLKEENTAFSGVPEEMEDETDDNSETD